MKKLATIATCLLITALPIAGIAAAKTKTAAKAAAPAASQAAIQLPAHANPIAKALIDNGVKTCAPRVEQVTDFLITGSNSAAAPFLPTKNIDQNMLSLSLEIVDKDKNLAYASTTFAPGKGNSCAASYDAIRYWPKKCDDVAISQFNSKTTPPALRENIKIVKLDANTRVFLMPAGEQGCVSIKKQLVY